jgi:DNA-binding SARP family transcriptional activator/DNA-binding beta-propeller fold protein YncE
MSAVASGPDGLHFHLLGRLEAYRDGVELELGPRKQRAVLALLLLNANRVVSTERLIDDLWGDSPPSTARAALQVYIAGLRKALANDGATLRTRPPGYVLELEPGALDIERFAQLRAEAQESADDQRRALLLHEALMLWRDAPLAELRAEPFAAAAAAQLEELRLGALEERIDADLALGRHAALVPELDALVAIHPYRERPRAQLMLALYRSGRHADALEAYQTGRRILRDELGLEPSKELRDLEAAILHQDERLMPAPERGSDAEQTPPPRGSRWSRGTAMTVSIAAALVAATAALLLARDETSPVAVPPNSVAVIDAETNRVLEAVPVGIRPGPLAAGLGSLWVGNIDDKTLSRIDLKTRRVVRTIPLGATPTAIAVGAGAVWVVHGLRGRITRVDPQFYATRSKALTDNAIYFSSAGVTTGAGSVWAVFGDSTLARVDPATLRMTESTLAGQGPAGIVAYNGSIWVSNAGESTVQRFDPSTLEQGALERRGVGPTPSGIAAGEGAVWVATTGDDFVTRIDPASKSTFPIRVGDGPTAVAVGAGAVWVANTSAGTVSRVDAPRREEAETIELGAVPSGIALANGLIWVAAQAP